MRRGILALALGLFAAVALAEAEVPYLTGRVMDLANLLDPETRASLDAKLAGLEERTGAQLVVLTVPSLEDEPIERFGHRVASAWKLGQEDKDNGALLIVAPNDRKMRVEVGRGLEPVLTDLETNIVQTEVIIPHFKQNDFSGGVAAGVDSLIQGIEGEVEPSPQAARSSSSRGAGWPFVAFGLFFLWPFVREAARSRSWFLFFFLMPFFFFLGLAMGWPFPLFTLGAWVVLFPILRKILPKTPKGGGRSGGGGWWLGGLGGGGWSSGSGGWSSGGGGWSGGGGGFSGGGGSFGGGGSSSSW